MSAGLRVVLVAVAALATVATARAVAPGAARNGIAAPGGAADPYPFIPRVDVDNNSDGVFEGFGSGSLIAPDVVLTAGHVFGPRGAGAAIPATRARAAFGGAAGSVLSVAGSSTSAVVPVGPGSENVRGDMAVVRLGANVAARDYPALPIMPRATLTGETNWQVGYGGGHAVQKAWSSTRVDAAPLGQIRSQIDAGETYYQPGDSGGPGMYRATNNQAPGGRANLPAKAYLPNWSSKGKNLFVTGTVSGNTNYPTNPPGTIGTNDALMDVDDNRNYIYGHLPRPAAGGVKIYHNLPGNPQNLPANTPVAVLIEADYAAARSAYVFEPVLHEDDTAFSNQFSGGDIRLAPTNFYDDLVGFGFSAGEFNGAVRKLFAWDFTTAGSLAAFAEFGNPLDPPLFGQLDWIMTLYEQQFDLTANTDPNVTYFANYANLEARIVAARAAIDAGNAVRGPFALAPEPGTLAALAIVALLMRRRGR